jgi:hypothetical protein
VIEEIYDIGLKVVGVKSPAAKWDGDSELMLFIALAVQRNES